MLFDSLEYLDLGSILNELERKRTLSNGNNLFELPDNFGNLKNLRELNIDENWICKLPENFGNLSNLVSLDLNHNSLSTLPNSFCDLTSLEVCMLSMNSLEELPEKFGCLSKLKDLRLDNNKLHELPESFKKLTELEILDLYSNNLKVMPPSLTKMKKLRRLYLDENNFNIPKNEVPDRSYIHATYTPGNPDLKDDWRSKSRNNILEFYTPCLKTDENFGIGGKDGIVSKQSISTLQSSLQSGSSIDWQHENSMERPQAVIQRSFQNQAANGRPFCCNSCPKEDRYAHNLNNPEVSVQEYWDNEVDDENSHDVPLKNESEMEYDSSNCLSPEVASHHCEFTDLDSKPIVENMCDTTICCNSCIEQDLYHPNCHGQEVSVYSTAESWDNEVNDENFQDPLDNSECKISSEIEDWESEAVFENPCGRRGIHVHPTSEKKGLFFFLPADIHPASVPRNDNTSWFCADDGQFEDADL